MDKTPIFLFITRSFWLAVATAALLFQQGEPVVHALAMLLITFWTWIDLVAGLLGARVPAGDAVALTSWLMQIGPLITFLAALQQRSGASRPYTLKPKPETVR